ncbi:MAG: hypothetical protein ACPL0C_06855 [Candidatus Bathyarchaeales archaeon]
MAERKQKHEAAYIRVDEEEIGFELEPAQVEVGSGYTVSISYDEDTPVVDVKTYGEVDIAKLRKEIQRIFPDAKIRHLNQVDTVTIVKKHKKKRVKK